jgi:hypothetical protein
MSRSQRDESPTAVFSLSRPERILLHSCSSSVILTRLSGPRYRPTTSQKIWQRRESNPDLWIGSKELWPLDHRGRQFYAAYITKIRSQSLWRWYVNAVGAFLNITHQHRQILNNYLAVREYEFCRRRINVRSWLSWLILVFARFWFPPPLSRYSYGQAADMAAMLLRIWRKKNVSRKSGGNNSQTDYARK